MFANDIFSVQLFNKQAEKHNLVVFDSEKQFEWEILTQLCFSKHQHCVQCEINKKNYFKATE